MARLYGWGASVVILGALFKINHYYGANMMLIIGLGTEAIIFFFSAFEPPHVEPDWSLVYPELAGIYHGGNVDEVIKGKGKKPLTQELDDMLGKAKIGPELIESLGKGLRSLSDTTAKLNDVSGASMATDEYIKNMKGASQSVGKLSESYLKTSQKLEADINVSDEYFNNMKKAASSIGTLSTAYAQASEALKVDLNATNAFAGSVKTATETVNAFAQKYAQTTEILIKSAQQLDFSKVETAQLNQHIKKISDNLAALNTVYELQLQGSNQQAEATAKLQVTIKNFLSNLEASNEKTGLYKDEVDNLTKRVAALNNVYGNMLAAMNVNVK
jgi:gliding motility-associated protein GldL